jgi:hypothetical protein
MREHRVERHPIIYSWRTKDKKKVRFCCTLWRLPDEVLFDNADDYPDVLDTDARVAWYWTDSLAMGSNALLPACFMLSDAYSSYRADFDTYLWLALIDSGDTHENVSQ